jgi:iron complex outermembrane receptor protein
VRIESRGNDTFTWTFGASYLHRTALAGFDAGWILAPNRADLTLFPAWNEKRDEWWGVYGQLGWRVNDRLELTAAARYDDERYENTTFTDRTLASPVPVFAKDGSLIDTQREEATAFQPKGQVSYHFTDDLMGYLTVSRGFRAGYFNTGAFTLPEKTTNYEVGFKSSFLERRVIVNAAAFHIDYSDQQFSTVIAEFPFRIAVTIPQTKIDGLELESTLVASRFLTLAAGLGYLDAEVGDGTRAPAAPRFNANASVDFMHPLFRDWSARLHVDGRHNTLQYLSTGNTQAVPSKTFLNLRAAIENERYQVAAFVRNATDERQATLAGALLPGGYVRYQNSPRSYGIELRASF